MSQQRSTVYPQAFPMTFDEIEEFLELPLIAKLSTHNKDGTIHTVPIWFKYRDGEILLGTQEISQKAQNLKRDSRVTVLVDTTEPRLKGVIVYGHAELVNEDVIPTRISIFEKYLGPEDAPGLAEKLANTWTPVAIRIKPDQIISFDYSKGFGLGHATSNRGADHLYALPTIAVAGLEHAAADLFPDLLPDILDPLDEATKPELVVASENYSAVSDALGVCKFTTTETYALRVEDLADALTAWGWPVDGGALLEAGERIVNLERILNAKMGISSQDDCLPERFLSEPVVVSGKGEVRTATLRSLPEMLSRYYSLRGWTIDGRPTKGTCERLGLTRWREA